VDEQYPEADAGPSTVELERRTSAGFSAQRGGGPNVVRKQGGPLGWMAMAPGLRPRNGSGSSWPSSFVRTSALPTPPNVMLSSIASVEAFRTSGALRSRIRHSGPGGHLRSVFGVVHVGAPERTKRTEVVVGARGADASRSRMGALDTVTTSSSDCAVQCAPIVGSASRAATVSWSSGGAKRQRSINSTGTNPATSADRHKVALRLRRMIGAAPSPGLRSQVTQLLSRGAIEMTLRRR